MLIKLGLCWSGPGGRCPEGAEGLAPGGPDTVCRLTGVRSACFLFRPCFLPRLGGGVGAELAEEPGFEGRFDGVDRDEFEDFGREGVDQ